MEILNGAPEEMTLLYDGQPYLLPALDVVTVPDEAGQHFLGKYKRLGLRQVKFGDDPLAAKLECLVARIAWLEGEKRHFELTNEQYAQQKIQLATKSPAVLKAERELPVLRKAADDLRARLGVREQNAIADRLAADADKPIEAMIELEDLEPAQLREVCRDRGIEFKPTMTKTTLIKTIRESMEPAQAAG